MIRLLLITDDRSVLRAMLLALRQTVGVTLVSTIDGRLSARGSLRDVAPDVVVINEMCQRANSLARIYEAREALSEAKVVLLTRSLDDATLDDAFEAGADAAIYHGLPPATLGVLLREVVLGRVVHRSRASRPQAGNETTTRALPAQDAPWARTIA
jgi:DNA-binding NarL/FixJ family response regulator